ncbi:MAG: sugar ABC transporter permease [Planctomycetes bacterium]|nr:sugar ABC transporter permease [Planctomycetota bacterium]
MNAPWRAGLKGCAFILPWLIALCVFIGYPFLAGFFFSFCEYQPLKAPAWIGLENYGELAGDARFHRSLGVTLVYAAVAIPLGVVLAMTLAMFLNARVRGQPFYRVIFYIPHLVPTVVVAILWLWIFNPKYGLLNIVLAQLVRAVEWWTGLFFDLAAAREGPAFARGPAVLLALPAALGLLVLGPAGRRLWRGRAAGLRRFLAAAAVAGIVLAAAAAIDAGATWLAPDDVKRLREPSWLSDGNPMPSFVPLAPPMALWALIVMSTWGVGQMAVIYLAKLQDVPAELYEAADIDGAGWLQKTRRITLPMISPVILFNVVMAIIGTFQIFAEPYIMTQGGPEDKTRFVAMFIYDNAFQYQRAGYASAVAWVLFLLIVAMTLLAFRLSRRHVYYEGR